MQTHVNKGQEDKSKSLGDNTLQKQSNRSVYELIDNRKEAVAQQKLVDTPIQKKPNDTGLPDNLKSGIENMSGYSMDDVKVHYNSDKPAQLNAHAYAQGTDIHVASGQEQHLPHEAWHVVQQKQGRVQPTTAVNGAQVNDNVSLETEADIMGEKALQLKTDQNLQLYHTSISTSNTKQLASDYSGLLPSHDTNEDSYRDGNNNEKKEFTYHHIIPENKLVKVAKEFIKIKNDIKKYGNDDELKDGFTSSITDLQDNAKKQWFETRLTDFQYYMNKEFADDGLLFTKDNLKPILERDNTSDAIIKAVLNLAIHQTKVDQVEQKKQFESRLDLMKSKGRQDQKMVVEELKSVNKLSDYAPPLLNWMDQYSDIANIAELKREVQENMTNAVTKANYKNAYNPIFQWFYKDYYIYKCNKLGVSHYIKNDGLSKALASNTQSELEKIVKKYALPHDDRDDAYLKSSVQWNPGNIHRGPSSSKRLDPDKDGFEQYLDDGGDEFEKAAVQILTTNHYRQLYNLNNDIDAFLANTNIDAEKLRQAKHIATEMRGLQNNGLTQFDPNQWESIQNKPSKMRLKENGVTNDLDHEMIINPPQQINPLQNVPQQVNPPQNIPQNLPQQINQPQNAPKGYGKYLPVLLSLGAFVGYQAVQFGLSYFGKKDNE